MEDGINKNIVPERIDEEHHIYKFNFINTPWDDRTPLSRVGIVSLLVTIFVAIVACVINNFIIQFKETPATISKSAAVKCRILKLDEYLFVARIHSTETQELLCVGAVVGIRTVLASGVCVKSGPVYLKLGSASNRACRKGFPIKIIEPIQHEAALSKELVLLTAYDYFGNCGEVIDIGTNLRKEISVRVIGKPLRSGLYLSLHYANLTENAYPKLSNTEMKRNTICVVSITNCPIRAGDLMLQNNDIFGLASTSTNINENNKTACFADIRIISGKVNELLGKSLLRTD